MGNHWLIIGYDCLHQHRDAYWLIHDHYAYTSQPKRTVDQRSYFVMNCPHATAIDQHTNACGLGLYGGRPSVGICHKCQGAGENTTEFAAALFARVEQTHPANRPRLSGCCDRADQA